MNEFKDVFVKTLKNLITEIGSRMSEKNPGESESTIINYKMGIKFQKLAQLHGVHYCIH